MSTEAALLAAVAAAPGDSLPRLVYADWLDEQGDPRAEMVRVMEEMRHHPVWADEYQRLRPARNRHWASLDPAWLEAMGYQKVYRPLFGRMPEKREHRWRLAEEFIDIWHGGLKEGDGISYQQILRAEKRLGFRLPTALREWYELAGNCDRVWSNEDRLIPPKELEVDEFHGLGFRHADQWATTWYIRQSNLGLLDPPVFGRHSDRVIADSVTEFALYVMVSEAQYTDIWGQISLDRSDGVPPLARHYQLARLPSWYGFNGPIEVWEGTDTLIMCGDEWWSVACRTEAAYSELARLFGNSVDRLR